MSGNHCEVRKAVSRGKGRSVVAKAAYNARTQLDNERFGEKTANYGRKGQDEVAFSGIFVDPKRNAPDRITQDRNRLWNEAANAEGTTKNAREGQEIIAALPHQLTDRQREYIVKDFARELARSTGRVIDVNIHRPPVNGDERNHHVHMLMTVREIGPNGFGEKLPNIGKSDIREIKQKWSERGARELRKAGFEIEADRWAVGHLKQEEQLKDALRRGDLEFAKEKEQEAGKHLGPEVTAMERAGIKTDRGNIERQKFAAAQEVLKLKAELAVIDKEISREVSAFVEQQERETRGGSRVEEGREAQRRPKTPDLAAVNREIVRILEQRERALGNFDALVASHPSLHPDRRDEKLYVDWLTQRHEMREEEKDQQRTLDYVDALIADAPKRMAEQKERQAQERESQGGRVQEDRQPSPRPKAPELGRDAGQIRMAFSLTNDAQSFANAIEDRGMIVARVTAADIEKDSQRLRQEWEEQKRNPETWMQHKGGYEDLSGNLKAKARRSYEDWQKADQQKREQQPEKPRRDGFTLEKYVEFVQDKWQEGPQQSALGRAIGGVVIVTVRGDVHPLTSRNTGMEKEELKAYLAQIDPAPLLSVQDARRVMGDVYQQARTEKIIAKNERYWPTKPPEQHAVTTSPAYHFEDAARATAEATAANVQPPNLRGTAAEIWRAYNVRSVEQQWTEKLPKPDFEITDIERTRTLDLKAGRDPNQFAQALEAKGITLARATKEEAERSRTAAPFAKAIGSYTPLLREGEFVAVDKRGQVYQLSQHTTGAKPWEVQRFLNKVEWENIQSVEATKAQAHTVSQEKPQDLRGSALEIWEAHHNAKTAAQFEKKLTNYAKVLGKQGLALAVVTEGDQSITPNVARGSFVVVNQKGYVYELNQKTTGRSVEGAQQFMRTGLDPTKFASVTTVRAAQITKMQEIRATEVTARSNRAISWGRAGGQIQKGTTGHAADYLKAAPAKTLNGAVRSLGGLLGGLFSALVPDAPKTPEQVATLEAKAEKREIDWSKFVYDTDHERAIASQQEQLRHRQQEAENYRKDRDRDGRDR